MPMEVSLSLFSIWYDVSCLGALQADINLTYLWTAVNHLITPPLNGQILPGITRDSLLSLSRSHISSSLTIPGLPTDRSKLVVEEREFGLSDLKRWSDEGKLKECFGAGTAASTSSGPLLQVLIKKSRASSWRFAIRPYASPVICPVERIGIPSPAPSGHIADIHIPTSPTGLGPFATALHAAMAAIQEGRLEGPEGWSVPCKAIKATI
jgi:hypothetical protein